MTFHLWVVYFIKPDKILEPNQYLFFPSPCLNFSCHLSSFFTSLPILLGSRLLGAVKTNNVANSVLPWTLTSVAFYGYSHYCIRIFLTNYCQKNITFFFVSHSIFKVLIFLHISYLYSANVVQFLLMWIHYGKLQQKTGYFQALGA